MLTVSLRRRKLESPPKPATSQTSPTAGPARPFSGRLLIADRGNNRLLVVNAEKKVLWRFPSRAHPAPPGGFYFPDDAFFTHGGTGIISNEEQNERIVQLAFPSGKLLWSYGHPGIAGSEPGYLHEPDDAYLLAGRHDLGSRRAELPRAVDLPREEDPQAVRQNRRAANTNRRTPSARPTATRRCPTATSWSPR